MSDSPRDGHGRWKPGFGGGGAGGYSKHRAAWRKAIKPRDIRKTGKVLLAVAFGRDVDGVPPTISERLAALREILDRTNGRPIQADMAERIEALEATLQKLEAAQAGVRSLPDVLPDESHGAAAVELGKQEPVATPLIS